MITDLPVQHHRDTTAAIGSVLCQRLLLLLLHFLPHTKINSYRLKVARKHLKQLGHDRSPIHHSLPAAVRERVHMNVGLHIRSL